MAAVSGTSGAGSTTASIIQPQTRPKATAPVGAAGEGAAGTQTTPSWSATSPGGSKWKLNGAKPAEAGGEAAGVSAQSEAQAKRLAEAPTEDVGPNSAVYKSLAETNLYSGEQIQEMLSTKGGVLGAKQQMATANSQETLSFWNSASKLAEMAFELVKAMIAAWKV